MMDIFFNDDYAKEIISNSEIGSLQKNVDHLHADSRVVPDFDIKLMQTSLPSKTRRSSAW